MTHRNWENLQTALPTSREVDFEIENGAADFIDDDFAKNGKPKQVLPSQDILADWAFEEFIKEEERHTAEVIAREQQNRQELNQILQQNTKPE